MSTPTRFDPFIKSVARRAENIYSKMAIRRDESEDIGRRKKGERDAEFSSVPWEDTTDVSIQALRGFLEDLLGVAHPSDASTTLALPIPPVSQSLSAPTTAASQAAMAYRTTGRVVHDENVDIPPPVISPPTHAVELGDDFGDTERDMMRDYINDLNGLEKRGISQLTLRRSLTFLESIRQAIADLK